MSLRRYFIALLVAAGVLVTSIPGASATFQVLVASKAGAPPGFLPSDIAGLKLWLEADGNVYTSGTTQATNGQTVTTWVDASGQSHDATQATSGNRPIFVTGAVNGKPVIRFDGIDDFMGTASGSYAVQTYFIVFKMASGGPSYQGIITARVSPNSSLVSPSDSNLGFGTGLFGSNLVNVNSDGSGTTGATTYIAVDGSSLSTSDFDNYNAGVACSAGNYHYVTDIDTSASASGTKVYCIGADTYTGGGDRYFTADIALILVYDSNITGTNQTNVVNYIKAKYGF